MYQKNPTEEPSPLSVGSVSLKSEAMEDKKELGKYFNGLGIREERHARMRVWRKI